MSTSPISKTAAERVTITAARYARGKMAVRSISADGYKTRAARLCEAVGARWTGRENAYICSPTQAERVRRLHDAGWNAAIVIGLGQSFDAPADLIARLPEPWMKRKPALWIEPRNQAAAA